MGDTIIKQDLLDWLDEQAQEHLATEGRLMADGNTETAVRANVRYRTCVYIREIVESGAFDSAVNQS